MKVVQCYELFGGMALIDHAFFMLSFLVLFYIMLVCFVCDLFDLLFIRTILAM